MARSCSEALVVRTSLKDESTLGDVIIIFFVGLGGWLAKCATFSVSPASRLRFNSGGRPMSAKVGSIVLEGATVPARGDKHVIMHISNHQTHFQSNK